MSLAAVPAYFLARRILPARLALLAAGLTVLVPAMLYTGVLMTENAFYPIFLVTALVLVADARAADAGPPDRPACALRARVRDPRPGGRAVRRRRDRAASARPRRAARPPRHDPPVRVALRRSLGAGALLALARDGRARPLAARPCSAPTGPRRRRATRRAGSSASSSTTPPGSTSALGVLPFAALLAMWLAPRRPTPAARAFTVASLAISVVARGRGRGVRVGELRRPDRGAQHVLPRAVRADRAARARCRRGRHALPPAGRRRCRGRRRAAVLHPVQPASSRRARSSDSSSSCRGGGRRTT